MCRAFSGTPSAMNVSEGVCRTPVCRPTSVRRMPLADSSAVAVSASSSGEPSTV